MSKHSLAPRLRGGEKLSFSEKLFRLRVRFKDAEWRRYYGVLLAGKFLGLIALLLLVLAVKCYMSSGTAFADDAAPATAPAAVDPYAAAKAGDINNPLNTVWTLIAAFLVFGMQAGFTMLEAGFCRSRETVNVLVECVFDTCLCGFLYFAFGYAFMFGAGNGFIGWHDPNNASQKWFFLSGIGAMTLYGATGVPVLAHWIFQFAFADCASTICSGTMIGRTAFWGDILYSVAVSGFIYPIIGHWTWGPDGFLYTMGSAGHFLPSVGQYFHDFAGSTVVHSIGGWIALAGGIVLGPRLGRKFKRDGGGPMLPHDLVMGVIGGFILWFGWYGFNPGSTLSAMDMGGIARVAANTTLAACTGGMMAEFFVYARTRKFDAGAITNGFLAGLVAITCPCYWVSPTGACCLGAVAGVIVILAADLLEFVRIDDPIGAWPVHGVCGIWGTLSLGLFASGQFSVVGSSPTGTPSVTPGDITSGLTGLFYGGGTALLKAQIIGSAITVVSTFAVAMVVFGVLHMLELLRVSREGEIEGLDLHEHGIPAYPEYVISPLAAPAGMGKDLVNHAHSSVASPASTAPSFAGAVPAK
jgi:Amt family ammonium transporter